MDGDLYLITLSSALEDFLIPFIPCWVVMTAEAPSLVPRDDAGAPRSEVETTKTPHPYPANPG